MNDKLIDAAETIAAQYFRRATAIQDNYRTAPANQYETTKAAFKTAEHFNRLGNAWYNLAGALRTVGELESAGIPGLPEIGVALPEPA